jgi:hypothetical protein
MNRFDEKMADIETMVAALRRLGWEAPALMEHVSLVLHGAQAEAHFWGWRTDKTALREIVSREARVWGWRRVSSGATSWNWECERGGIALSIENIEVRDAQPEDGGLVEFPPACPTPACPTKVQEVA